MMSESEAPGPAAAFDHAAAAADDSDRGDAETGDR
jgi:hypothetical protein